MPLRKKWEKLLIRINLIMIFSIFILTALAQTKSPEIQEGLSILQILPALTFLFALITGGLNLYVMNKLGKTREDVLNIIRAEVKEEVRRLETQQATREQVEFLRREFNIIFSSLREAINEIKNNKG